MSLVVLLLLVIALASQGIHSPAPAPSGSSTVAGIPPLVVQLLFVVFLGGALAVVALSAIALFGLFRPRKKNPEEFVAETPRPPWWSGVLALLLIAVVVAGLVALLIWAHGALGHPQPPPGVRSFGRPGGPSALGPGHPDVSSTHPLWLTASIGFAVGVVAFVTWSRRRGRSPAAVQEVRRDVRREEAGRAVEETIEDLRRDPDPRHAVVAAYARMERTFTLGGWPRRASATPFEYLGETLRRLAVPAPAARTLTELFEVARFSRHRVDDSMKQRAIEALVAVRQALEADAA